MLKKGHPFAGKSVQISAIGCDLGPTDAHKGRPYYTTIVLRTSCHVVYSRDAPCGRPWGRERSPHLNNLAPCFVYTVFVFFRIVGNIASTSWRFTFNVCVRGKSSSGQMVKPRTC